MIKIILSEGLLIVAGIISLIFWHKKIDPKSTWIYGIYILIQLIFWLFVLIGLQQYWLAH